MKSTDEPIIIENIFNASGEKIWNALTSKEEMIQWFFDNIESFEPEVGFTTQFSVQSGDRTFTHSWEVTEVIPNQRITYTWKYDEYPGDAFVTFELEEGEGQTKLTLTLVVVESFPQDIPEFKRESCIAGWNYFLGERFKGYLGANSK